MKSIWTLLSIAVITLFQPIANTVTAADSSLCDLALKSGAFNTNDYAQTANVMMQKKDEVCRSEFNSQGEAISSARKSGGSFGYGGFTLGASDARQTASGKWSVADSKYCHAKAEELDSFTNTRVQQQVADIALEAWSDCINKVETNKLFVKYKLHPDGSGMTGTIIRNLRKGAIGKITGIMTSVGKSEENQVACKIGTTPIETDKLLDIQIEKSDIAISCSKSKDKNVSIALTTSQEDTDWILLPSRTEQVQSVTDNKIARTDSRITQTDSRVAQLEARLTTEKFGSSHQVLAQVLAQASCTALGSVKSWIFAVPRDCKDPQSFPSCAEICKGLSSQDKQVAEHKVELTAFSSLHIYDTEPAKGFHSLGLKTSKYGNEGTTATYCGPNFCCCGADYSK